MASFVGYQQPLLHSWGHPDYPANIYFEQCVWEATDSQPNRLCGENIEQWFLDQSECSIWDLHQSETKAQCFLRIDSRDCVLYQYSSKFQGEQVNVWIAGHQAV